MSAETKWTPGPLIAGRARSEPYMEVRTRRGHVLATVYGTGGDANALDCLPAKANATLYAAAPDLYAALVETEAALELGGCYCASGRGFVCSRCQGLAMARAALARARGETP